MRTTKELKAMLSDIGFIPEVEACKILKRRQSGSTWEWLLKQGVHYVAIPDNGGNSRFYDAEEIRSLVVSCDDETSKRLERLETVLSKLCKELGVDG